jgi:TonB family protein
MVCSGFVLRPIHPAYGKVSLWVWEQGGAFSMRHFSAFLLPVLAAAAAPASIAAAQPVRPADPARTVMGWTVVQRSHGCDINAPGSRAPSALPTFHRPFRGDTRITLELMGPAASGLKLGTDTAAVLRAAERSAPATAKLVAVIDSKTRGWKPQQLVMINVAGQAEPHFRGLLGKAPEAALTIRGRSAAAVPLPPLAAWQEADRCLAEVGQALLTASPPNQPGGTPAPRDKPWPRQPPSRWFDSGTYPAEAVRAKAEGNSRVSVAVDRWGYPTACKVVGSAGHKALDALACSEIMARGRFFPSLDQAGKAVAGVWESTVVWRVPAE